jgi:LysM repeat protein
MKRNDDIEMDLAGGGYPNKYLETEEYYENEEEPIDFHSILRKGIEVPYVVIVVSILLLIVLFMVFFKSDPGMDVDQIRLVETRIKQLENRLMILPSIDARLEKIEQQGRDLKVLWDKIEQLETSLEPRTVAPPEKDTGVTATEQAEVLQHQVLAGETLYNISRRYGLSVDELLQLNNLKVNAVIYPGQKLLVRK